MPSERLSALDAFRGLTIMGMILVNNPGTWSHVYAPLLHADWDGLTPTDLVFPFFLFMVGVSLVFSLGKRLTAGTPKAELCKKVIFRAVKIYVVAMLLYVVLRYIFNDPIKSLADIRYIGVLQRIALVFLICGLLYIYTNWKTQLAICVAFLIGYAACLQCIPTPGFDGKIHLEAGRNITAWADSYLVPGKTYRGPWDPGGDRPWEEDMLPWDPEGHFSTFPAVSSGLIGIFAGMLLLSKQTQERKIIWLFFAGLLLSIGGYLWGLSFPINKCLWSSSYVLLTSGFACLALAACLFYVDLLGHKKIAYVPIVFGCNAITMYILSDLLIVFFYGGESGWNTQTMNWMIAQGASAKLASMVYGLLFVAVNFIPAWLLYRMKIFIRL